VTATPTCGPGCHSHAVGGGPNSGANRGISFQNFHFADPVPAAWAHSHPEPAHSEDALTSTGSRTLFSRGDVLVREGDGGGTLYVLFAGNVKVMVSSVNGADVILALRARGDLIGEFAAIDGKPRTASAGALDSVVALRIARPRFLDFCARYPAADRKIMQSLTAKLRAATENQATTSSRDPETKVARILCELAAEHGRPTPEGVVIDVPLTQADLGAITAVSTSTLERILKDFRDQGILLSRYRRSVVLDIATLRKLAN
jgi:CRP/FNR family cyclic AMP-dependent transcriptional regulator